MVAAPFVGLAVGIAIIIASPIGARVAAFGGNRSRLAAAAVILAAIAIAMLLGALGLHLTRRKPVQAEGSYPPVVRLVASGWSRNKPR